MKKCVICDVEIIPKPYEIGRPGKFSKRKFCSLRCWNVWTVRERKNHPEWIEKMAKAKTGQPSPKKGMKFPEMSIARTGAGNPMYGRRVSEETRQKHRDYWSTHKPWNWQGGEWPMIRIIRESVEYDVWRIAVFMRDNHACRDCGKRGGDLQAHHIKALIVIIIQNDIQTFDDARRCKELWDVDNGRTLCIDCHKETDNYGARARQLLHFL